MSTGGIFKLLTNTGVQDKLLTATDFLNNRLKIILQKEIHDNNTDNISDTSLLNINQSWLPIVNDINKTHVMFVNNTYKPFVATGFEYNKISASGIVSFGSKIDFVLPVFGDYINDIVVHVRLTGLQAISLLDRVRYVSLLGHRLFNNIDFSINNNKLDSYTTDDYNTYYQFHVPPNKQIGWLRNMGQEIPNESYLTPNPTTDMYRQLSFICDGNQTFKQVHNVVELWIPLLFWFNDVRNSLPNISIPYGQTKVTLTLSDINDICTSLNGGGGGLFKPPVIETMELYMNNIFMNVEVTNIIMKRFGFSLIRVHGKHSEIVSVNQGSILLNQLKWPTENLYTCFQPISNLSLSQYWHNVSVLTQKSIKVPVTVQNETLAITGDVLNANLNTAELLGVSSLLSSIDNYYTSYAFYITGGLGYNSNNNETNQYNIQDYIGLSKTIVIENTWFGNIIPDATTTFKLVPYQIAINNTIYYKETPSITTLELKAYGITLYRNINESFYNSYIPYRYGTNMNTPADRGWYMLNFNFYPGEHQPSGHINLSRAREFYINYTSSFISRNNPTRLLVLSDAINFLLVKDGSAVLRYST